MSEYLFTSESVTEGHPDKIADQISDGVLDAILAQDPMGRVACETLITTGQVMIAGEVTTTANIDIPRIVRDTITHIGYTDSRYGFDAETCGISVALDKQSPDIGQGVTTAFEKRAGGDEDPYDSQGAGDQGLMFGFACTETPVLMPLPIILAHRLVERLSAERRGALDYLRPEDVSQEMIHEDVTRRVIQPVLEEFGVWNPEIRLFINPTGKFVIGGPMGDCGLTGRKIIVDTYGGMARHGGGAFSGKDPSKVDRSAAYAARWVAKNVVAAGLADRCEVQVAYAIGVAHPVSINVQTFGTEKRPIDQIVTWVSENFDLRPAALIDSLDLRRPIYQKTAAFGHFGRTEPEFTWENTDIGQAFAD